MTCMKYDMGWLCTMILRVHRMLYCTILHYARELWIIDTNNMQTQDAVMLWGIDDRNNHEMASHTAICVVPHYNYAFPFAILYDSVSCQVYITWCECVCV